MCCVASAMSEEDKVVAMIGGTTTGATLAANGLKPLEDGTILESQAQLAASLNADWTGEAKTAAESLLARLGARERAKTSQILRVRLDKNANEILAALAKDVGASVLSLGRHRIETTLMVHVSAQDFFALCGVHIWPIGRMAKPL